METEDQQLERLKEFWNEHGKGIVAGIVIGFGLFYGWRYYDAQTIANQEAASEQYSVLSAQLTNGEENASTNVQAFLQEQGDSAYALMAALELAKQAVEQDDFATAVSALQHVRDNGDNVMRTIASVRQARVLLAQEQYDAALNALNGEHPEGFTVVIEELRGDIHVAQGDTDSARSAYERALSEANGGTGTIELKLNNLAVIS